MMCVQMRPLCWTWRGIISYSTWQSVCITEELQLPITTVCRAVKVS